MKKHTLIAFAAILACRAVFPSSAQAAEVYFSPRAVFPSSAQAAEVYFSPRGGAEAAVVRELGAAKAQIRVMSYQMTSKPIAQALIDAKNRGLDVKVIVDRSQRRGGLEKDRYCCAYKVAGQLPTQLDDRHPIMHHKVVVIDGKTVITGSFNFSNAAEKANAENLLVLRDADLAKQYLANWETHAAHSEAF